MIRAIEQIQKETQLGKTAFEVDPKLQVWVLFHLQIIGEASRGLLPEFRERHPDPTWSSAIGLRNILIHHYFEIDPDLIWQVVQRDLPRFRQLVQACLETL
jgi:uncharacterized protein with HEPN domain